MEVPEYFSKKLDAHVDDPSKIFDIICDKYENKDNNKLSNLCKELKICTLNNMRVYPDDWLTDLSHLNYRIEKIIIYFKKTEKVGNANHE